MGWAEDKLGKKSAKLGKRKNSKRVANKGKAIDDVAKRAGRVESIGFVGQSGHGSKRVIFKTD